MRTSFHSSKRLVLGTVQLGLDYGISNKTGKPDRFEAEEIVLTAVTNGIREFDTAQAYGDSEKILGGIFKKYNLSNVRVISKFSPDINLAKPESFRNSILNSINNLNIPKLFCIMFHREEVLNCWNNKINDTMLSLIDEELVENIGISVSTPQMAIAAIENDLITAVQLPSNVLDRRFENAGVFETAIEKTKNIYVRSIFLQGLLMMPYEKLTSKMRYAENTLKKLALFVKKIDIPPEVLYMAYVRNSYKNAKILFGAETAAQIKSNIATWNIDVDKNILEQVRAMFHNTDEKLLNPALWPV